MIKALCLITLIIAAIYFLKAILGFDLLADSICYLFESIAKYRNIEPSQGFYNELEVKAFSKIISRYFTAITGINFYYDSLGWQYTEFKIVPLPSGNSPGTQEAIAIDARNYIRQQHGFDNPNIVAPVLTENFLCIQIPCSKKAHVLAQSLNFSPPPKCHAPLEEEIK